MSIILNLRLLLHSYIYMKKHILTGVALLATFAVFGQRYTETEMRNKPLWVDMMDAPQPNYTEAKQAFDLYWEHRERPVQEHDLFTAPNTEKEKVGFATKKQAAKPKASQDLAFEYKRFKKWLIKNEPFVQADGTLMTAEQRVELWKKQHENRK